MAAAAQAPAAGQLGNIGHRPRRLQVPVVIREADNLIGVAYVEILRIGSKRVERDPERLMQASGENRHLLRMPLRIHAAEDANLAGLAFGQEDVAVGRGAQLARVVQTGGVKLHLEALGSLGPRVLRARDHRRSVVYGLIRRGRGQVGRGQVAARARRLVRRVGERLLPGQNLLLLFRVGCNQRNRQKD